MLANILFLILLIFLSGFFSSAEIALFSLNVAKVRNLVDKKKKNAKKLEYLKNNAGKVLITILIGNNLVNIGAASLATVVAINALGSVGAGVATGIMTLLILIFGEILPKSLAQKNPAQLSLFMTPVLLILFYLLYPASYFLSKLSRAIYELAGGQEDKPAHEEEVKALVELGEEQGTVERDEKEMIKNIFLLNDIKAEDIMTVRSEMISFESNQILGDVLNVINQTGHSRFPVYFGSEDNVKGILFAKDVLEYLSFSCERRDIKIKELMKPALYIPEQKPLDSLLREFQKKHIHIAAVVDEHGDVTGIVTLEDLLEEIVGEISDETDVDENTIQRLDKKTIIADASTAVGHINRFFNVHLSDDEYESIAHIILEQTGRFPQKNDELTINKVRIIIEEAEDRRIKRVKLIKLI
ncbi:MAG: hemolysin family protein [Patescibacteria group bacterium]